MVDVQLLHQITLECNFDPNGPILPKKEIFFGKVAKVTFV